MKESPSKIRCFCLFSNQRPLSFLSRQLTQTLFTGKPNNTVGETNKQDKLGSSKEELREALTHGVGNKSRADQKCTEGDEKINSILFLMICED